MTWDLLKATGKLFVDLARIEVGDPLKQLAEELTQPYTDRQIAQRLKPDLSTILPENQEWYKMRLGVSEEQVGKFLGLPDAINNVSEMTAKENPSIGFDEIWSYRSKSLFEYRLGGMVWFKNQRVTYFQVYYDRGKRRYAREVPPSDWIKARQSEGYSDELGTIL